MNLFTNPFRLSQPSARPSLLLIIALAFGLSGLQTFAGRGYYGGKTVAAAGPHGAVVAGPNGAAAVGRNGGVAVSGGYHPPVHGGSTVAVVGPHGAAVAGPNGAVVVKRSYAPCYPAGYIRIMPAGYTMVRYGGFNCYFIGGVYYRPEFYGGSTVYVVVKL